ncbi:phage tail-collar fiber domain-containing protein [Pseudomonas synxantha]|uniref:phage tail-collar fiber domain-containing protein n=1 Tax=Pseudomonas synxantha TaxID=47883 RepID=UPI002792609A|nr:phage tail protein [Pseudomonas synxantha]MDQ0982697.1 hypothetical protein [Pseudomonas synxantha]
MIDQNSQFFATLTKVGEAKQANADALGIAWKLTQMGVGDAGGTDPIPSSLQTKLINERRRAPLNQLSIDPQNPSILIAEQVIPADVGGFWVREIGLYDADNDLVAVANCAPSFKPILSQGSGRTQIVRMNFVVKSANNVELKIDPSVVLATRAYVDDMKSWFYSKWVAATEKVAGVLAIATQFQTDAGNDDATAVTPKKLSAWFGTKWLPATEAASGVLPIATQTEVLAGFGDSAVVTPKKLTAKLTSMVATQAETNGGEDGTKFVTPVKLATWFGTKWLTATEATSGVLPIATQTEVLSGFGDSAVVTPKKLTAKLTSMVATQAETNGGEDGTKFVTPVKLATWFGTKWLTATEATSGVLPIATQTEVLSGFGDSAVVTPKKLTAKLTNMAATQAETNGGEDGTKFVTPLRLSTWFGTKWLTATEATSGVLPIATQTEVNSGFGDSSVVTPLKLAAWFLSKWLPATEAASGVLPIATQTEVLSGFGDSAVVTPKKLSTKLTAMVATQLETNAGEDGSKFITPLKLAAWFGTKWLTATEATSGVLPIAKQVEVDSGFGDSSVVTPKKLRLGFQFIIGVNGAIVFPTWLGGFVLQWGAVTLGDAGVTTISFPIKFPSQRLATWSAINANISSWANTVPGTGTAGGTDPLVNMAVSYNDNGGVTSVSVGWFAIGK